MARVWRGSGASLPKGITCRYFAQLAQHWLCGLALATQSYEVVACELGVDCDSQSVMVSRKLRYSELALRGAGDVSRLRHIDDGSTFARKARCHYD